jgi:tetratricopeptide (TPR) repeat protein
VYLTDVGCEASVIPFKQNFGQANQDPEKPPPTRISNHEEQSEFNSQVQGSQKVSVMQYNDYSFDWNSVDVLGSPDLTKLIGALTIEECDIPFLDLASDSLGIVDIEEGDLLDLCGKCDSAEGKGMTSRVQLWSTRLSTSMKTSQTSENPWIASKFVLMPELSPFPTSPSQSHVIQPRFFSSSLHKHWVSETECKIKIQKLKHMQDSEIIHLVEAMGNRAERFYDYGDYEIAETWFRRVVRAKQLLNWYKPHQTLWACLRVVCCVRFQFRYEEAHQLLQGLHDTIERIAGTDNHISVQLKDLRADLLRHLGFSEEEEEVRRQLLQINLNTLGMRHPKTIKSLEELGSTLHALNRHGAAQHLLETSLHFRIGTLTNSDHHWIEEENILWDLAELAQALNSNGRYDESENLLDFAHNFLGDVTRVSGLECTAYHQERARTYRLQKRFEKAEKILRGLLKYHLDAMAPGTIMESMTELAAVLVETGRHREAVTWSKREYFLHVKTYGLTHHWTMACCLSVGLCYINQGRYYDGKLFFEEVIEMFALSGRESDSDTACIQKIKSWIDMVEAERVKDLEEWSAETSDSMDFGTGSIEDDGEADYEDMSDVSDPLDY